MIGASVGSYVVEALIGQGGMGAVYRARHVTLGRAAAIKVLLPQYSSTPDVVRRFFNEAKASTTIQHPGIVEVYDFGQMHDGTAYIAMELLRGESLAARLQRGVLTADLARALLRQICGALGAAHEHNIVHRDLKPDNIFIVPDAEVVGGERIKLLDFGIAKLLENPDQKTDTKTGALIGTPMYMSPEQCRGIRVDRRSDIYALGCIYYEMVSGHPPFVGQGFGDVLVAHISQAHVPLRAAAAVSVAESELADKMLAKDPSVRVGSTVEVVAALDRISALPALAATAPPSMPVAVPAAAFASNPTPAAAMAATPGTDPVIATLGPPPSHFAPSTPPRSTETLALITRIVGIFTFIGGTMLIGYCQTHRSNNSSRAAPEVRPPSLSLERTAADDVVRSLQETRRLTAQSIAIRDAMPNSPVREPVGAMPAPSANVLAVTTLDEPVVRGAADAQIIARYANRYTPKINYCYERTLSRDPALAGSLKATFEIRGDGLTQNAAAVATTDVDRWTELSQCVARVLSSMSFPGQRETVLVEYSIHFHVAL